MITSFGLTTRQPLLDIVVARCGAFVFLNALFIGLLLCLVDHARHRDHLVRGQGSWLLCFSLVCIVCGVRRSLFTRFDVTLRKRAYSNILKIPSPKTEVFR